MKHIPLGIRDFLPSEVKQRRFILDKMINAIEPIGYERIITPSIEFYDSIQQSLGNDLLNNCIVFFDGAGSRLILRPDHTSAIARIVSTRLRDQLPLKLYYYDPVFRKDPSIGETEIYQFGFEHIGVLSIEDEANLIITVSNICQHIGLDDIEIHMAHPKLFSSLTSDKIDNIKLGNLTDYSGLPERLSLKDIEDDYFSLLYQHLKNKNVLDMYVNKALYKDLSYYNGIYFDLVSKKFGKVIGSGGRYDVVLQSYGMELNAIGFAFNIQYLERIVYG